MGQRFVKVVIDFCFSTITALGNIVVSLTCTATKMAARRIQKLKKNSPAYNKYAGLFNYLQA
jgi:hypothetical protein